MPKKVLLEVSAALTSLTIWTSLVMLYHNKTMIRQSEAEIHSEFVFTLLTLFMAGFIITIYLNYKTIRFKKLRPPFLFITYMNIFSFLPLCIGLPISGWIDFFALGMGLLFRCVIFISDLNMQGV
jgi:uncharacterized membrane protein YozB (DUF420 family)